MADLMSGAAGDLRAVLRIRPFRRLWAVLSLSAFGDWLGLLAASLFAASQFNNSTAQGAAFSSVIIVRLMPSLILGPVAGVFADRFDRRITMAVCDLVRFALFASIPLVGLWTNGGVRAVAWVVIAQFIIEATGMLWMPAKEAAVPNLLPRARLETANQLSLITTYGVTPVLAASIMAVLERSDNSLANLGDWAKPADVGLYLNALTFLAASGVVYFLIPEISKRDQTPGSDLAPKSEKVGVFGQVWDGWRYIGRNKLVRGLVLGILGAFAGAGVVAGTGQFYAQSLGAGDAAFTVLFATIFIGLGFGIAFGPGLIRELSRRRWFGLSIVLAGFGLFVNAVAPHLWLAVTGTLIVGAGAGMAFLAGVTLLGREVEDAVRGRIFAFIAMGARVVLMLAIAGASLFGGFGRRRTVDVGLFTLEISFSRVLMLVAGVLAVLAGIAAFRHMDDKPGVPVLADLWGSMRGRPLALGQQHAERGFFVVFEGGEGSGKSTQAVKLAAWLKLRHHEVVLTREPGATEIGSRIRGLLLAPDSGTSPAPRTEALLYAADRAQHVSTLIRPALDRGAVVVSDRYIDSSLAYQGSGRELPPEEVAWLSSWATDNLKPDLVVVLDIDPAIGLMRAKKGGTGDRLEGESLSFHEKVRYKFLDLAAENETRYLILDATDDEETIAEKIRERVAAKLPEPQQGNGTSAPWPTETAEWPRFDEPADDTADLSGQGQR